MEKRNMGFSPTRNSKDSTVFGGIIVLSDYYTNPARIRYKRSPIAGRILSDRKFDIYCKRNIENNKTVKESPDRRNFKYEL